MRRSEDDLLLAKAKFQILAVRMPKSVIDVAGHDLNDNDMVAFKVAIILPDAFSRGVNMERRSTKPLGKFVAHRLKICAASTRAYDGQQDLDQIRHDSPTTTQARGSRPLAPETSRTKPTLARANVVWAGEGNSRFRFSVLALNA